MVVYDFVQLDIAFEAARARLLEGHAGGLDGSLPQRTRLELGVPVDSEGTIAVPFEGHTPAAPGTSGSVRGHLEVTRLGPTRTHLSLLGAYERPGAPARRQADRLEPALVTEADLRVFLRRVADRLTDGGVTGI